MRRHEPGRRSRARLLGTLGLPLVLAVVAGCASDPGDGPQDSHGSPAGFAARPDSGSDADHRGAPARWTAQTRQAAQLATAAFQDVSRAEAAGYASTLDTLGCFADPRRGGMGVHWLNDDLLDGILDVRRPEALVYELGADGNVVGLVAHEYIVPTEAWTRPQPPKLAGVALHRHPTLPLWVLHAWLWKGNPAGDLEDWNPAVRPCPAGDPVVGRDLPTPGSAGLPPGR